MKQVLLLMSLLVVAAGAWLAVMESILRHSGYASRLIIAAGIATQGIVTALVILLDAHSAVRSWVLPGALLFLLLGSSAILRDLQGSHFEGFVLLIGLALIAQGSLTVATVLPLRHA